MRLIYLKHSTFLSLKILLTHCDVRSETSKHHFLKSIKLKINTKPTSDANFQSISRHSSEQSIAHYSSRPTVSQLKGVSESRTTGHKFPPSLTLLVFKTRIEWPPGWPRLQVFKAYFFNSCNIQDNVHVFQLTWGAVMTKTDLTFPALSLRFVDFAVQFCSRCKFLFHEKR